MKKIIKLFLINSIVFAGIAFILFFSAEVFLKFFGKNFQIESDNPSYIHRYHRHNDRIIDADGYLDINGFRTVEKTKTGSLIIDTYQWHLNKGERCSIIIIGDSSPFGDGRLANETWPHELQKRVDCKIFTFAQNGWTTLEMFEFHEMYLKDLNYDYLIKAIVHNDPHLRGSYKKYVYDKNFHTQKYFVDLIPSWDLKRIYWKIKDRLETVYIVDTVINNFLSKRPNKGSVKNPPIVSWGYSNYAERLWEDDIQDIWRSSLKDFYVNNFNKKILYFFAINLLSEEKNYSDLAKFFDKENINYLYCIDERIKFGQKKRKNWANLADAHPGTEQIELFVNCLSPYFKKI